MRKPFAVATVTIIDEDGGVECGSYCDQGGDMNAAVDSARAEALERYSDNIGGGVSQRVIVQRAVVPAPRSSVIDVVIPDDDGDISVNIS